MLAPLVGCCFITSNSSGRERARLLEHAVVDPDFSHVVQQGSDAQPVQIFGGKPQLLAEHAPSIWPRGRNGPACIRIFFVDGRGEHADGAQETGRDFPAAACFSRAMKLSMSSAMLLNVWASSLISAAPLHGRAFVKFAAADGARGRGQRADGRADAHGEKISQDQRCEGDAPARISAPAR